MWPEGEISLFTKFRISLHSQTRSKSSAHPPPATTVPSPQPSPHGVGSRVVSLSVTVATLAEWVHSKLVAFTASLCYPSLTQVSSHTRLGMTSVTLILARLLATTTSRRLWEVCTGLLWFPLPPLHQLVRTVGLCLWSGQAPCPLLLPCR